MRVRPPGERADWARPEHAGHLFTDRESEAASFKDSLARFRDLLDADAAPDDARLNVLTFYGTGGIGKTALSRRLQAWVLNDLPLLSGWGSRPATAVDAMVRLDLHESRGQLDVLDTLLALRRAVASIRRNWGGFDLALAAYWSARNPGQQMPKPADQPDIEGALVATATGVLGLLGVPSAASKGGLELARLASREMKKRRNRSRYVEPYPGFADFLERCAELPSPTEPRSDIACEIAGVLAWELSKVSPTPLVIAFVDTADRLQLDPSRSAEVSLNQLVGSLPNVLFVVTGRDHLDWYDGTRLELSFCGIATWPGLDPAAAVNPRQHRVGNLSGPDTRRYLQLAKETDRLPLDDQVIEEIVTASGGLPQYLELACQVARGVRDEGGSAVPVERVTGSLDALVLRVLSGIPEDEQSAIRAACLFRAFDPPLAAVVAGVEQGHAERAVRRSIVDSNPSDRLPFRVHDEIRRIVRQASASVPGGWAAEDWAAAGRRGLAEAQRRHELARDAEDRIGVLRAIALAIVVVCETPVVPGPSSGSTYRDWLTKAIVFAPSFSGLRSHIPVSSSTEYGGHVLGFLAGKSYEVPVDERLAKLGSVFESDHPLALAAGRHAVYELRNYARWDEALQFGEAVIARDPSRLNTRQRAITLCAARRFRDALNEPPDVESSVPRSVDYAHGRPERYFAEIEPKIETLREQGRMREHFEDVGDLLLRRALIGGVDPARVRELEAMADEAGNAVCVRSCLLARVLMGDVAADETHLALGRIRLSEQQRYAGSISFRYAMGECVDALVNEDGGRLVALRNEVLRLPRHRGRSWIPVEFFLELAGHPLPEVPTQWLQPVTTVRGRWEGHLSALLARRVR